MAHDTCIWTGASGEKYTFYIWPRHPGVKSGQDGNYIYAKKDAQGRWAPIYIGQGDLSVRLTTNHHRHDCIEKKGATAVHLHTNAKEADRLSEERDLLKNYPQAYAPTGCNVKEGG